MLAPSYLDRPPLPAKVEYNQALPLESVYLVHVLVKLRWVSFVLRRLHCLTENE